VKKLPGIILMTSETDKNITQMCKGRLRKRSILLREASVKYMQMPKKIKYPWKKN
jgi:hypothetical protein